MGYITIAALAFAVPIVILSLFVPNKKLGYVFSFLLGYSPLTRTSDGHNLVQEVPSSDSVDVQKPQR
ncbi:hypothetical protein BDV18DRAFT_142372 [Aspergillus unguis]